MLTALGENPLDKAGSLLMRTHKRKQNLHAVQVNLNQKGRQEVATVGYRDADGDWTLGVDLLWHVNMDEKPRQVVLTEETGNRHEAQQRGRNDIDQIVRSVNRAKAQDDG